jgi:membrane protein YqaA with SNARE-associated domain
MGFWDLHTLATPALYALTLAFALVSGLIPFVLNIEVYLVAVAALTKASPVAIVGLTTLGQMAAKYLLYLTGSGALNLKFIKREKMDKAAAALQKRRGGTFSLVAFSAVVGLPSFYAVSLLAGAMRVPVVQFMVVGTIGRLIRFGAVYLMPGLFQHAK